MSRLDCFSIRPTIGPVSRKLSSSTQRLSFRLPTIMASSMFLVVWSLLAAIAVALTRSEDTTSTRVCDSVLDEAHDDNSTATMDPVGPEQTHAFQAPLLGASRLWSGKSLWQRQTCDPVCQTNSGGCCSGCSNLNDGSTPCGTGCCVYPYVCGVNSECKIPV
jgi:hypothetical protein